MLLATEMSPVYGMTYYQLYLCNITKSVSLYNPMAFRYKIYELIGIKYGNIAIASCYGVFTLHETDNDIENDKNGFHCNM